MLSKQVNFRWVCNNIHYEEVLNDYIPIISKFYNDGYIKNLEGFFKINNCIIKYIKTDDNEYSLYTYKSIQLEEYFENSNIIFCNSCIIHYLKNKPSNSLINNIISTFKNLLDETHTKPNKNLKIYIFDNLKDLQQLIGDNCVDGFFDSMTGNMYMCDEIKFFKHELMHFVMYNWIGWPAALIHEGIAESFCIEESFSNYSNDNMSIEKILNKEIYSKETYYQLGMFFLFIRKKFSLNILKNIYRTIKGPRVLENISILLKLESDILLESFNTWRDSYSNGIC